MSSVKTWLLWRREKKTRMWHKTLQRQKIIICILSIMKWQLFYMFLNNDIKKDLYVTKIKKN